MKITIKILLLAFSAFIYIASIFATYTFTYLMYSTPATEPVIYTHTEYKTPPVDVEKSNKLFDLVNDYRKDNGVKPLKKDYKLCRYATLRAYETDNKWVYDNPHELFYEDADRGYLPQYERVDENLAQIHGERKNSAKNYLYNWEKSPPHNATMLQASSFYSCVVCVNATCVQEFLTAR